MFKALTDFVCVYVFGGTQVAVPLIRDAPKIQCFANKLRSISLQRSCSSVQYLSLLLTGEISDLYMLHQLV